MIERQQPDYTDTPASPGRPRFGYAPVDASAVPCVSIVTPFYDAGPAFHETAACVLSQSLQQFEWIIVDDGTRDPASLEMLGQYRHRDRRIRVIDHPVNRGLSAARNTGFAAARSPYVLQLDADDLIEPTTAEKLWWFLETHPEHAFVSGHSVHFGAIESIWTGGFHEMSAFLENNRANATCLIRTVVHRDVGGYDEENRGGLEDWEFWLRCADRGYWGATLPEPLDWYRRRTDHGNAWSNWDGGAGEERFRARLRELYPKLWTDGFPAPVAKQPAGPLLDETLPGANRLQVTGQKRLLLIVPWLSLGGSDRFNLDLVDGLAERGWQTTIVATVPSDHPWLPLFTRRTPDVFLLPNFLPLDDYPRFLRYLLQSRGHDAVVISNSETGYLLAPYLSAHAPDTLLVSYCHALDEDWKGGGYPRMAVEADPLLDWQLVSSELIARWMADRGCQPETTRVLHVSVDTGLWRPDAELRARVRAELRVSDDDTLILTPARMSPEKQPEVLARVWRELRSANVAFRAVVAGDGPELPTLRMRVEEYGLEPKVSLLGATLPDRMLGLLAAADICFLPSRREGIAVACFEAMSAGVAVVTADVGAQRELIVPGTGILVESTEPDREVEQYTAVLAALAAEPDARRRLGEAARSRVRQHFELRDMHDRLDRLLRAPRPRARAEVSPALASLLAARAIGQMRVARVADELWAARQGPAPAQIEWMLELEKGKEWLESQYHSWRSIAEAREQSIVELKAWIAQLEEGKRWLETQYQALAQLAAAAEQPLATEPRTSGSDADHD